MKDVFWSGFADEMDKLAAGDRLSRATLQLARMARNMDTLPGKVQKGVRGFERGVRRAANGMDTIRDKLLVRNR